MEETLPLKAFSSPVVVIWSMACPGCREALVDVDHVYRRYRDRNMPVALIGVNFDIENLQGTRAFLKGEDLAFPNVWDPRRRVTRDFRALDYTFSLFVIDNRGVVVLAQYDHPPDLGQLLSKTLDEMLKQRVD